jgi:hypothetical protein
MISRDHNILDRNLKGSHGIFQEEADIDGDQHPHLHPRQEQEVPQKARLVELRCARNHKESDDWAIELCHSFQKESRCRDVH